jgi:hypothetical protein
MFKHDIAEVYLNLSLFHLIIKPLFLLSNELFTNHKETNKYLHHMQAIKLDIFLFDERRSLHPLNASANVAKTSGDLGSLTFHLASF